MNFTHYDLGNLDKGRVIEITLQGNAANVHSSIKILPPVLPTIQQKSLSSVPTLFLGNNTPPDY